MFVLEKRQVLSSGKLDVTYNEFKTKRAAIEWLHIWEDTYSHLQAKGIIKAYRIRLKEENDGHYVIGESKELQKAVRASMEKEQA